MKNRDKENPDSVTYSQGFAAIIKYDSTTGGKKLVLNSPKWYANQLQKFKDGENVTLMIHNRKPKRSEQQNRYYWGVYLPLIAEKTGEQNIDRLHELFKGLFLTSAVVQVLGKAVRMKKSTTQLNKVGFSEYIMAIETETGVAAPPVEDY